MIFLLPDQPPLRGREAFAAALRSALGQVRIEGKPDIKEIHVTGDYAFCGNQLSLTVTPIHWSDVVCLMERDGRTLDSLLRCQHA